MSGPNPKKNYPRDDRPALDKLLEQMPRRAPLSEEQQELMLATLVRNREAFAQARDRLRPDHFGEYGTHYALAYKLVGDYFDKTGQLPGVEWVKAQVAAVDKANPRLLDGGGYEKLSAFLDYAYDPDGFDPPLADPSCGRWATSAARQMLDDRLAAKAAVALSGRLVAENFAEVFAAMNAEADQNAALEDPHDDYDDFAEGWHQTVAIPVFSTGVSFFDRYMDGGHANGEVYTLMGPYASCKTLCAAMLVVEAANQFWAEHTADPSRPRKVAFWVSYEARKDEMRSRAFSYGARVQSNTMKTMPAGASLAEAGLSRTGALKPYELTEFAGELQRNEVVPGEYERILDAEDRFRNHLALVDMNKIGTGGGGIKEATRYIKARCQRTGVGCGLVVFDYLGNMVKRFMAANEIDSREERALLEGSPLVARDLIALPFNCPVWLLHQFSGAANAMSPNVLPHHTDAKGCKSLGENAVYSMSVGLKQLIEDKTVARFGATKTRRSGEIESTVICIDGAMGRAYDAGDRYSVTEYSRGIMKKGDAAGTASTVDDDKQPGRRPGKKLKAHGDRSGALLEE